MEREGLERDECEERLLEVRRGVEDLKDGDEEEEEEERRRASVARMVLVMQMFTVGLMVGSF